jgi:lipopolysaccharide transport system ATP-binding protein
VTVSAAPIVFDRVWKKFNRAPRFNSLRDLIPAMTTGLVRGRRDDDLHGKEFWALQDVSFEVHAGQALGIIGQNGAGKSTALKVLTRLLRPDRGASLVRGRAGALVEVAAGFHPDLTGRENVFMQGAIMGMRRAEIFAKFDSIVDFAGVGEFIDMPVKRYSSGMNARLGFAVAAHLDPDVLIIDEVLSVGDLAFQEKCYERMQRFVRSGIAVVLVSHNLAAIAALCHHVLVLKQGRVETLAPTTEAIARYANVLEESKAAEIGGRDTVAEVLDQHGAHADQIDAGAPMTIRVTAHPPSTGERFHSELQIRHLETGALIYRAQSQAVGAPPLAPSAAASLELTWSLRANLGRGHYSLVCAILNEQQKWVSMSRPRLFTIQERQSEQALLYLDVRCRSRVVESARLETVA